MGCCSKQAVSSTDAYAQEKKTGVAPATTRKCRDVLCTILFGVFWVGMIAVAIVGIVNGEPKRLLYGSDYTGATCGAGAMKTKPLTFYPRMSEDLLEQSMNSKLQSPTDFEFYGVCVAKCPEQFTYFCNDAFEAKLTADAALKNDDDRAKAREKEAKKLLGEKSCWFVAMRSQKVFYRCIQMTETNATTIEACIYPADEPRYYTTDAKGVKRPNELCEVKQVRVISDSKGPAQENPIYDKLQSAAAMVGRAIGDIQHSWEIVLLFGGVAALAIGLVFIFLMKYMAGCMVWVTLWSFVGMLLLFALMVSTKAGIITNEDIAKLSSSLADAGIVTAAQNGFQVPENLRASEDKKKVYAYVAYISYALTGVAFLLVCFFQKKIRISVGIIKESSRAIQRMPLLVLFPIVPFLMVMALFIYSAVIAAYIYSAGSISLDKIAGAQAASAALSKVDPDDAMRALIAYHVFGFLWTNQLINAISMCTIAGAVCRYYWSRDKSASEMGRFPILYSFKNCFRYHFGSLAFGALIIAIVQFVRAVLMYIDHQTQELQQTNVVVKIVLKIVQCCMWCLEKCLKFLSKNAYIMIAMKGHSFCASAKDAFKMIFSNAAQIATVSLVSFLLLSAAKIAITMACATMMFAFLEHNDAKYGTGGEKEISSPMAPILLTMVLAWFVASTFMGVYEMSIDTILLCFCEDREINKATGQYYMSDKLRKFVASVPVSKPAGDHHDDGAGAPAAAPPVNGSAAIAADI